MAAQTWAMAMVPTGLHTLCGAKGSPASSASPAMRMPSDRPPQRARSGMTTSTAPPWISAFRPKRV